MRVGILTMYHENYSYGGLLQAYALQQVVKNMGYECEQITYDYNERFREKPAYPSTVVGKLKKCRRKLIERRFQGILNKHNDITKKKYHEFMEFIPHSKQYGMKNFPEVKDKYDVFIVGGDQVWNMDYCDENFFLPTVEKKRKISYSASAGKDFLNETEMLILTKGINSFSHVSVREKLLKEIMNPAVDSPIEVVIDPVFLPAKNFWDELKVPADINEKYVLVYLLGYDEEERKRAIQLAKKTGLQVVFIPFANVGFCKGEEEAGDIQVWSVGPKEFLGLIDGAEYVLTDSFHATAFSIIFKKNFYCFSRPNKGFLMNSRIDSLLEMSGLKERYIDLENLENIQIETISYDRYLERIEKFRKHSTEWLQSVLTQAEGVL